jgi:hypothetical protein
MYDKLLSAANRFKAFADAGPTVMGGGVGEYQELLAGYGTFAKFTGNKNLSGVDIDSKQILSNNPTIESITALMGEKAGNVNINMSVLPNLNIQFNVFGNHPAVKNGTILKMLQSGVALQMKQAVINAIKAKAIMSPTEPITWKWIEGMSVVGE